MKKICQMEEWDTFLSASTNSCSPICPKPFFLFRMWSISHIYRAFPCETAVVRTNEVRKTWDRLQETFYKHLEPTFPDPIHQTIKNLYLLVDTQWGLYGRGEEARPIWNNTTKSMADFKEALCSIISSAHIWNKLTLWSIYPKENSPVFLWIWYHEFCDRILDWKTTVFQSI